MVPFDLLHIPYAICSNLSRYQNRCGHGVQTVHVIEIPPRASKQLCVALSIDIHTAHINMLIDKLLGET